MPRHRTQKQPQGSRDGEHRGWWRPTRSDPWQVISQGSSWREAWIALLEGTFGRGGDLLVLPADRTPADVPGQETQYNPADHNIGETMTADSIREVISVLTRDLAGLDALLKKIKSPLPDLDAAEGLVALVKAQERLKKQLAPLRAAAIKAAEPTLPFPKDDEGNEGKGGGKPKK